MDKLQELRTTTDIVKHILKTIQMSRNSDNHLYYWVCATIGKEKGIDIHSMSMPNFLFRVKENGFPQFESVRRARQKIQADYPELAGNERVEARRKANEEIFEEYAKGEV
jgi:hypothetical protein